MLWLKHNFLFIPLILIIGEILAFKFVPLYPSVNPYSDMNRFQEQLKQSLILANLLPRQTTVREFQSETEFYLKNNQGLDYPVVLSNTKKSDQQVAVLQKLLKIVNIKGGSLKLIYLRGPRPYATF